MLWAGSAAANSDASAIVRALEAHYQAALTLRAVFLERYSEGRNAIQVESGTVYFSRPGRMRWEYESPETKLFVVDGKHVWFYVPADRTVTRAAVKQSSDWRTPFALLTGKAKLARICARVELVPSAGKGAEAIAAAGNFLLRCLPRSVRPPRRAQDKAEPRGAESMGLPKSADPSGFHELLIETDAAHRLVRVLIREPGQVETEFRFGNWQENIPLPEVLFHFQAPAGVAIVDEAALVPGAEPQGPSRTKVKDAGPRR